MNTSRNVQLLSSNTLIEPVNSFPLNNVLNNTFCYLNEDYNSLLPTSSTRPTKILLVVLEQGGYGDIVFGIKFVRFLLNSFENIEITIFTQDHARPLFKFILNEFVGNPNSNIKEFRENVLKAAINYQPENEDAKKAAKEITLSNKGRITVINIPRTNPNDINDISRIPGDEVMDFDIVFISPVVRQQKIQFNFTNAEHLKQNIYNLSEYNAVENFQYKIGAPLLENNVPTSTSYEIGILLDTYNEVLEIPQNIQQIINGRRFSISYFYADLKNVSFMYLKKTNWFSQNLLPVFNYIKNSLQAITNKSNFTHIIYSIAKIYNLSLCFSSYIKALDKIRQSNEDIVVLIKEDTLPNFSYFLNVYLNIPFAKNDPNHNDLFQLAQYISRKTTSPNPQDPGIQFVEFPGMGRQDMLSLFQHSLPIVFLSGDQSVTDFISVNKYFDHSIFYQVLDWKRDLAKALGIEDKSCGEITPETLNTIRNNPNMNFRYKGLYIVNSLLIYSRQGSTDNCMIFDNLQNLYNILSFQKDLESITINQLVSKEISSLYSPTLNLKNKSLELKMESPNYAIFTANMLLDKFFNSNEDMVLANLYKGSLGGNVLLQKIRYSGPPVLQNLTKNEPNWCSLVFPITQQTNGVIIPPSAMAATTAPIINNLKDSTFIYIYETIDSRCIDVPPPESMLVFSEFPAYAQTFRKFLKTKYANLKNISWILFKVLSAIKNMSQSINQITHNNLTIDNILIDRKNSKTLEQFGQNSSILVQYNPKILDFRKASYTQNGTRYATSEQLLQFDQHKDKNSLFQELENNSLYSLVQNQEVDAILTGLEGVLNEVVTDKTLGKQNIEVLTQTLDIFLNTSS